MPHGPCLPVALLYVLTRFCLQLVLSNAVVMESIRLETENIQKGNKMNKRLIVVAGALCVTMGLSACTTNPYTGESEAGKSGIGAGLGAALGAGVGMLSSSKKDRGKGALIGAAAGAALGGGAGYYMDVQECKLRDKMKGTGVSVTSEGDEIVLNMPNNVTFDTNSSTLKPAGANTLTGVAMVLKEYPKSAVNDAANT